MALNSKLKKILGQAKGLWKREKLAILALTYFSCFFNKGPLHFIFYWFPQILQLPLRTILQNVSEQARVLTWFSETQIMTNSVCSWNWVPCASLLASWLGLNWPYSFQGTLGKRAPASPGTAVLMPVPSTSPPLSLPRPVFNNILENIS